MKQDENVQFVQGLENLQKELLGTPLRKMKVGALQTGESPFQNYSSPNQVVSNFKILFDLIYISLCSPQKVTASRVIVLTFWNPAGENLLPFLLHQLKMEVQKGNEKSSARWRILFQAGVSVKGIVTLVNRTDSETTLLTLRIVQKRLHLYVL